MTDTPQPRVPPEALTWCIPRWALQRWTARGEMTQKAHRVRTRQEHAAIPAGAFTEARSGLHHVPACGATVVPHPEEYCEPAPPGWPACRVCVRQEEREREPVPAAFREES